jgi:TRAP-type C4-dicarboxylate transport system permease small subunit
VFKLYLLSAALLSIVGISRYFDKVWQDNAPTTANPLDANWIAAIIIAVSFGAIIFAMFSFFTPAAFRVISRMLGMGETEEEKEKS